MIKSDMGIRVRRVGLWAIAGTAILSVPAAGQQVGLGPPWAGAPISSAAADYEVGPGDVLAVTVYRSPDLTTQFTVSQDGSIGFPLLGPTPVEGRTIDQIAALLARGLEDRGILIDPSVSVTVVRIGSKLVSVMGAVSRSGEISLDRPGMTLSAVLAQAGTSFGTGNAEITIVQDRAPNAPRERLLLGDIIGGTADRAARPGEILIVQAAPVFYVSGEVGRPGAYPKEPSMTVGQGIALAGGITPRGSSQRIRVIRKVQDGAVNKPRSVRLEDRIADGDLILVKTRIF